MKYYDRRNNEEIIPDTKYKKMLDLYENFHLYLSVCQNDLYHLKNMYLL